MSKSIVGFSGFFLLALVGIVHAVDFPKVIFEGDWSKSVSDSRARSIRGRLVLCESVLSDVRREVAIYVELQDVSEAVGESMLVFCDFGRTDFRPEYEGGLRCELYDKDKRPVKSEPFAFSGHVPKSEWVTLPSDATIRLRASPFGIHRENAMALCARP